VIAFDTETWLIAPGRLAPRLVCLTWCDGTKTCLLGRDKALTWFRAQLQAGTPLVGHNVAYDVGVLVQADPTLMPLVWAHYDAGLFFDTQIGDRLHYIAKGFYKLDSDGKRPRFSLAALTRRYLSRDLGGKEGSDAWRYRYRELETVPVDQWPEEARTYALGDADATWEVWDLLRHKPHAMKDHLPQVRAAWALHLVSAWGLRTDPERVSALRMQLQSRVSSAGAQLRAAGILRASGSKDTAEIRRRVEQALGDDAPKTETGKVSTARDVLLQTGDPELELLASISNDQKLLTTYIPVLERGTERPICPSYGLVESGRTSARGPNIQNQPRLGGVRECWVPRAGMVYVACDYHIAELCGLAQVCIDLFGASAMADAINAGQDLHLVTAASILGITYDEIVSLYAAGDADAKMARQLAKAANFGFPGGLGAASFCDFARATYRIEITPEEAKKLKNQWLDAYPEMRDYFLYVAKIDGTATQVRSGRVRGGLSFCSAANTFFQGLVADGAKAATYQAVRSCYVRASALEGCRVVAFVHDELILEAPTDRASAAARELERVMVSAMKEFLPAVKVTATPHLMRRWYKDAGPVYSTAGDLVPWEPT
jgi:DNA polymerase-1